ncbi:MAG: endopeptidase La [Lachnospiraceae bacterium]|nr:endopeptidase La [Lachnospiraceae bacterium]
MVQEIPVVVLASLVVLPGTRMHLELDDTESIASVEHAMVMDGNVFLGLQRSGKEEVKELSDICQVGVMAKVERLTRVSGKRVHVLFEICQRACVSSLRLTDLDYPAADIILIQEADPAKRDVLRYEAMRRDSLELFIQYYDGHGQNDQYLSEKLKNAVKLGDFLDLLAGNLPISAEQKLLVLEAVDIPKRYEILADLMRKEIVTDHIRKELGEKLSDQVEQNQREYILREQLAFIKKELNKNAGDDTEEEKYAKAVEKLTASEEIKKAIDKEIHRLELMSEASSDAATQRLYLETLLELPWDKMSEDHIRLNEARKILDADHYGLEDIKKRIIEYLAVKSLTQEAQSTILCLVGPPGTGKTSIARSIAEATGKKYVRVCLGGVRDEAEIRGHRRTYIGSMPGRITTGLKQAGVKNPLMLLDEIDKMSQDYKGDVASAMLEVLDSEQNCNFRDHYVELPMDLSKIMFIATANTTQTIPRPLLDRMEIIELSGYTDTEKFHIAKEHLFPKVLKRNGMKPKQVRLQDSALREVILGYTREAGVRELERKLDKICRRVAANLVEQQREEEDQPAVKACTVITKKELSDYLGKEKYQNNRRNAKAEVGVVRGLAWTSVGGDTLEVEAGILPGKGEVKLTGQMGDVMKESAMAAISYLRSIAGTYQIKPEYFKEHDIHIHIPEGAVPKDGPSAGITMATAVFSAMTNQKVRPEIAMTGEITLRGRILPIGGLKEKTLAAKQAGMKTVLVPAKNERDVAEISDEIKSGLDIVYVERMEDVLKLAIKK